VVCTCSERSCAGGHPRAAAGLELLARKGGAALTQAPGSERRRARGVGSDGRAGARRVGWRGSKVRGSPGNRRCQTRLDGRRTARDGAAAAPAAARRRRRRRGSSTPRGRRSSEHRRRASLAACAPCASSPLGQPLAQTRRPLRLVLLLLHTKQHRSVQSWLALGAPVPLSFPRSRRRAAAAI
jgi:hypothetical protein